MLDPPSNSAGESSADGPDALSDLTIEAEQALLGIVLFDNGALDQLDEAIEPRHFFEPVHARLFEEVRRLVASGQRAEPIVLRDRFRDDSAFVVLGGVRYLADLVSSSPPTSAGRHYAGIIRDHCMRRDLHRYGQEVMRAALDPAATPFAVVAQAESEITSLVQDAAPDDHNLIGARDSALTTLSEIENEAEHGKPRGLMTGLRCTDFRLGGLRPGHLIVLGGRPSMGKTALARVIAEGGAARNPNHTFVFFAAEMQRRELDERTLSDLSYRDGEGIAYQNMDGTKLTPFERMRLRDLTWKVPRNFLIDDSPVLSINHVRRRLWALKRKGPIGAAIIDYLQIMQRPPANGRNDAAVISEITSALKQLARQLDCCIVLLSQLSRQVESRADHRPQLADLRESGSIEQDANAVLFPFREFYYLQRAEPKAGSTEHSQWVTDLEEVRRRMDVICDKNRGGAVGTDHQEYIADYDTIRDIRGN